MLCSCISSRSLMKSVSRLWILLLLLVCGCDGVSLKCSCAATFFVDSGCSVPITPSLATNEVSNLCFGQMFPLGSWGTSAVNITRNATGSAGRSYQVTSCNPFIMKQYLTTTCTGSGSTIQTFPVDGSCLDCIYCPFHLPRFILHNNIRAADVCSSASQRTVLYCICVRPHFIHCHPKPIHHTTTTTPTTPQLGQHPSQEQHNATWSQCTPTPST
jgi:hypothetical protein